MALALGELAQRRDAFDVSISAERYLERCRLKTARLFECACLIGRAGAPAADEAPARRSAREIGLAFQLLDDVLDVTGPPERTGKARGTDLLDGTVTLPLILARERDPSLGRARPARASTPAARRGGLRPDRRDRRARARSARGARGRVEGRSGRSTAAGFDAEQRELLELVADGVVERYS